jgi:tetratricopeptide (TPR) repeat protein
MTPRPPETPLAGPHLDEETLARIAEHGSGGDAERDAVRHIARCRTCLAAYADAVRYRLALGSLHGRRVDGALASLAPQRPASGPRWLAAAATLAVMAAATWWYGSQRQATTIGRPPELVALLEHASADGLVLPGGEGQRAVPAPTYRSPSNAIDDPSPLLERLRQRYEADRRDADALYDVSACLATSGRWGAANDYINEGRAVHPRDPRFLLLAAVLARAQSRPVEALRLLSEARAMNPDDSILLLDEALVLAERGEIARARRQLQQVMALSRVPAISARAGRALQALGPGE